MRVKSHFSPFFIWSIFALVSMTGQGDLLEKKPEFSKSPAFELPEQKGDPHLGQPYFEGFHQDQNDSSRKK